MNPLLIEAKTISDAWFQLIYNIFDKSYRQEIQKGSFEKEQYRLQYPSVTVYIEHPWLDMIPIMPSGLNIPAPTTMEYVEDYFVNYLMNTELAENETYTYGSRINKYLTDRELKFGDHTMQDTQLNRVIKMLKETPFTNQAVIEIGTPDDLEVCYGKDGKLDPPCLRIIDFKVIPSEILTVSIYFRSWDLWAGFPTNLAGIELLKQFVAQESGLQNGCMYAYSAGLHIYGYQEEMAKLRARKDINKKED